MTPISRRWLQAWLLLVGLTMASPAIAIANLEVIATGPRAAETTLRLFDPAGKPVAADSGKPNLFSNLPSGGYTAETLVAGAPVGSRTMIRLDDGDQQARVDSMTGAVEIIRRIARRQQQQQEGWEFGVLGGYKRTPYRATLDSLALNKGGSSNFETDGGSLALEARYNLRVRAQQQLGAALFLFGTYVEYLGTDEQRRFVDFHPTPGKDSGVAIDEKRSVILGLGSRWNTAQQTGVELMLGMHWTQARITGMADESCCGGIDNRFSRNKDIFGPMLGVGTRFPLVRLQTGRPMFGSLRYTALHMKDIQVSGRSSRFPFDYTARGDGGWNHNVQAGVHW